ncbi:MAG: hypothetical protein ABIU58_01955, partial [Ramlibacter sp.]
LPKDVTAKLSDAFRQVPTSPEVRNRMVSQGADPAFLGSDDFAKFLTNEMPRWADAGKIEVVETRLADWRDSPPLAQLADLQSHGALVLGAPSSMPLLQLDLRTVQAYLAFDGQPVASTRGANPGADV